MSAEVEIFPIGIGEYDHHPTLDVDGQIARLAAILTDFGAEIRRPWIIPMSERGADAVNARLREWAAVAGGPTILYWVGHGLSDNRAAVLAHARSIDLADGLPPISIAERIAEWESRDIEDRSWLFVVIDACKSAHFAELLASELDKLHSRRRVVVIGTACLGGTTLGRFTDSLESALSNTFAANDDIGVASLSSELARTVPGVRRILELYDDESILHRTLPVPDYSGPLDLRNTLLDVLSRLPEDERRHFVSKAQGGELRADQDTFGEVGWYFVGRQRERQFIIDWLLQESGILIVTGRAGSGKSALLGDILVRSRRQLAQVLLDNGLLSRIDTPPPEPFDVALHLTGLGSSEVIARLSRDLSLSAIDNQEPLTAQFDQLENMVRELASPLRLLLDALDEAVDPLRVAALLRRLSAVPGIQIIVGTRRSTHEGPDQPDTGDTDLIDALAEDHAYLVIERDPDAIAEYVVRRLKAAQLDATMDDAIWRAAMSIRDAEQEFLYARLAVHELIAQPDRLVLTSVTDLLGPDHRSVFAAAVERLALMSRHYQPLLVALALAQGRGAPILDGVWTSIAQATREAEIYDDAIKTLLADAAPYLALDSDHGQTVYRLAHRTFAELLTADSAASRRHHSAITRRAISELAAPHPNIYWLRYTSAHAAEGGRSAWEELERSPWSLDILNPDAVARDAMRSLFGFATAPPNVAGIISAVHELRAANVADRAGVRQLASAYHTGTFRSLAGTRVSEWAVEWAVVRYRQLHATLTGHTDSVWALATVPVDDGRMLLASGSEDGTVRLWDPSTGAAVGEPLRGHSQRVSTIATVPLPNGLTLIATGSDDRTVRLWDPTAGVEVCDALLGYGARVSALAAVLMIDGRTLLASGSGDGIVRLWDPATQAFEGKPFKLHDGGIWAMSTIQGPDGRTLIATGGWDEKVIIWDPNDGTAANMSISGQADGVRALAGLSLNDGTTLLASASRAQGMRLWNPTTKQPVSGLLIGHTDQVQAAAVVPMADGRVLLATASRDLTIRLWDPISGAPAGEPLRGHTDWVLAVAAVPLKDGRTLLASGSADGTVRLWDSRTDSSGGGSASGHTDWVSSVAVMPVVGGRTLLATGSKDQTVRLWDPATGRGVGEQLSCDRGVQAIAAAPIADDRSLIAVATGGEEPGDHSVRLWNPDTGVIEGELRLLDAVRAMTPDERRDIRVSALAAVPLADGRTLLAVAQHGGAVGHQGVALWDPITGSHLGKLLIQQSVTVQALAAVPLADGRTLLATAANSDVQIWDPITGERAGGRIRCHAGPVTALAAVPMANGYTLLATAADQDVEVWDPITGGRVGEPLRGHSAQVAAVAPVSMADGRALLASAGADKTVWVWDLAGLAHPLRLPLQSPCHAICSLPVAQTSSPAGQIAVGLDDGIVVLDIAPSAASTSDSINVSYPAARRDLVNDGGGNNNHDVA